MKKSFLKFCTNRAFALKEWIAHPQLGLCWEKARAHELLARDELERIAAAKLDKILRHAETTVPYYRKWFEDHGHAANVPRVQDFPIAEKNDIRGHDDEFVSDAYPRNQLPRTRTSGSTGESFRFGCSKNGCDSAYAILWRGICRFGISSGIDLSALKVKAVVRNQEMA